ncbi:AraC family transcriptional regulator [Lacimicrobium alkaliphilum]|uniref:AraC family transcriptional regulator n=1 Tax=Lacimicrobium alkaliphilum TaxID=1526571 RepID=A0A0U3AVD6_9ALTE|nr:AraC family transcriptional regulator [Lacimicrobium alkaliphilum]ALS96864.1 AraC family transcriptional regulator [Lacimicrobium alkaliphilum]
MTTTSCPVFWRDPRMPYVELRKVEDGRQVCYAPHSHTQWSIGVITGGSSTFCYRHDTYQVGAGDLVLMNPLWVHACNPVDNQPWSYLMMYVDTEWLTDLRYQAGLLQTLKWQDIATATLSERAWYKDYRRVAYCLLDPGSDLLDKQTAVVGFLSELMHKLANQPVKAQPPASEILEKTASYLDSHAATEVSLETLCKLSGFSAGHLVRAFKKHFGLTPHAYLINRRVQLGRQELKNGTSIIEAALNTGFADQPHFQRVFKRLMAATPNQYRASSVDQQVNTTDRK